MSSRSAFRKRRDSQTHRVELVLNRVHTLPLHDSHRRDEQNKSDRGHDGCKRKKDGRRNDVSSTASSLLVQESDD